jgi:predicted transcriptional regulator
MKQYKKFSEIRRSSGDPERRARIQKLVESDLLEMSLADLRRELGVTQVEMAAAAEMTQGGLSDVENRSDHLVSTLRRCVRALGGDIEVIAVVGDKRVRLTV